MPVNPTLLQLAQLTAQQNPNPSFGRTTPTFGGPIGNFILPPGKPAETPVEQQTGELFPSLEDLRQVVLGAGDVAQGILSIPAQALQLVTPGLDIRKIPGVSELFPQVPDSPESLSDFVYKGASILGLPQLWERSAQLANSDPFEKGSPAETFARFAGEITGVSPVLDVALGLGIDPDRVTRGARYRNLPIAVLSAIPFLKGVGGAGKLFGKAPIADIATVVAKNDARILSAADFGAKITPEGVVLNATDNIYNKKFALGLGDMVITPEGGISEIVGETARSWKVLVGEKTQSVSKRDVRPAVTPYNQTVFDIEKAFKIASEELPEGFSAGETSGQLIATFKGPDAPFSIQSLSDFPAMLTANEWANTPVNKRARLVVDRVIPTGEFAARLQKRFPDMSLEAAVNFTEGYKNTAFNAIEAAATEAGKSLEVFSEGETFAKAQQRMSKDLRKQLDALNRDANIGTWQDWWSAVINKFQLSAMVSQVVTTTRNTINQFGAGLINGFEHATQDVILSATEHMKARGALLGEVNPKFLTDGKLDNTKLFADTLGDLQAIAAEASDFFPRLAFNVKNAPAIAAYSNKAVKALMNNTELPPVPEVFKGNFHFGHAINELFPVQMSKMLQSPTGEVPISLFNPVTFARAAESVQNLVSKSPELPPQTGVIGLGLKETLPAMVEVAAGAMTTLNRMGELWQRRMFFSSRIFAAAKREGVTMEQFMEQAVLPKPGKGVEGPTRPQWIDKTIVDASRYALDNTFSNTEHGGFAKKFLELDRAFPPMRQLLTPFPNYLVNRMAFLSERNPLMILRMFNDDFAKKITGQIDTADVVKDLERDFLRKNPGKSFNPPSPEELQGKLLAVRADTQRQAAHAAAQATVGFAAVGMASVLRNSAIAGPRYSTFKFGPRDENGNQPEIDLKSYDWFTIPMAIAHAEQGIAEGRKLGDIFTVLEMGEIVAGIRRIDDTGLAIFDLPQIAEGKAPATAFLDVMGKILGSNIGKMFTFLRQTKDLAGIADLRVFPFEGSDELQVSDQQMDPMIGPAIANLPRGLQRAIMGEPLPGINSPFKAEHLHNEFPIWRQLVGANIKSRTQLEEMIDTTDITMSDAIGRQPSREMKQMVAAQMGRFFETPHPSGITMGDFFTERVLQQEAVLRSRGILTADFRKEQLRSVFTAARQAVEPYVIGQILASGNRELILQTLGKEALNRLSLFQRHIITERMRQQ